MDNMTPGLMDPPSPDDVAGMQVWLQQVTEILRIGMGQLGAPGQMFVRFNDMVVGGLATPVLGASSANLIDSPIGKDYEITIKPDHDLTPPSVPANVSTSDGFGVIYLTFDFPNVDYPLYAEVWRSVTELRDDAVLHGSTQTGVYADNVGVDSTTYYYWIRYVKTVGDQTVYGSYHSDVPVSGLAKGSLSGDIIEEQTIRDAAIHSLTVDKLVGNVGNFIRANIGYAVITNAMIGNEIKSNNYVPGQAGWILKK